MPIRTRRLLGGAFAVFAAGLGFTAQAQADAGFHAPGRGDSLHSGSMLEVRWTPPLAAAQARESELLLSLDGGITFPIRVSPEMPPRAGTFRWIVPALASGHARLALRSGSGESSKHERLELVSEEFRIEASPGEDPEGLARGTREWWTKQALTAFSAQDLFSETMGKAARLVLPGVSPDLDDSEPTGVPGLGFSASRLKKGQAPLRAPRSPRLEPHAGAPFPLRL